MKSSTCLCRPSVKVRTCEKKRSYLDSFYFLAEGGRAKIFKVDFCQMLILINYFMLEKILFSYSKIQIIHSSFAAAAPSGLLLLPLVWLCFCDFSGDYLSYLLLLLSLRGSYSLFKNWGICFMWEMRAFVKKKLDYFFVVLYQLKKAYKVYQNSNWPYINCWFIYCDLIFLKSFHAFKGWNF